MSLMLSHGDRSVARTAADAAKRPMLCTQWLASLQAFAANGREMTVVHREHADFEIQNSSRTGRAVHPSAHADSLIFQGSTV